MTAAGLVACGGGPGVEGNPGNLNAEGNCTIPAVAGLEDVSAPRTVVGDGTPASCSSAAFVAAVAKGGVVTFNCGINPVTIVLTQTAKIVNDTGPRIVIDGGSKVTLDGGNARRILYMNTCDQAQHWTTTHCNNQDHPRLTVQNLTFVNGDARSLPYVDGQSETDGGPDGGAIFVNGGQFKIVNSRFFSNRAIAVHQDRGGGAVRVTSTYNHDTIPTYITNSTFGGRADLGNQASSGGGLSGLWTSFTITNSLFSFNRATGYGGNPGHGGNGGGIYMDGNNINLRLCGTRVEENHTNAYGRGIFYVSNNKIGVLNIHHSVIRNNIDDNTDKDNWSWDVVIPQVAFHTDMPYSVTESDIPPLFHFTF